VSPYLPTLAFLAACTGAPGTPSAEPPASAEPDRPNVLVVSLDTLRSDHLALYGYPHDTAPTLSAIAAEGGWMSRTWSQAPQTDGTHASMFTGRFASSHGKYTHEQRLPASEQTFAEYFAESGYRTWAVATSLKFDEKSGFRQGFQEYDLFPEGPVVKRGDEALARALEQLERDDGPWLGFLHLFDVHAPYTPPAPHRERFLVGEPALDPRRTVDFIRRNKRAASLPVAKLNTLTQLYDGGIHHVDARVAVVWEKLKASPRDTVLVLTSDHGEAFFEHRYLGHSKVLWEEVVRIPWIVWAPGRVQAGKRLDTAAQTVDLMPTIIDLAGLPPVPGQDGESFAPALRGDGPAPAEDRLVVLQELDRWGVIRTTADRIWKLTIPIRPKKRKKLLAGERTSHKGARLFDLASDPAERNNLAAAHPDVVASLTGALADLGADDPLARSDQRDDITEDELEGLRAIGYVE